MKRDSSKPILPWPVLGLGALAAGIAVAVAFLIGDSGGGSGGGTPTPFPTATLGPVAGTIGYITPDGNFGLMDGNGGNQRALTSDGTAKSFAWAPDGSIAAVELGVGGGVHVSGVKPDGTVVFDIDGGSQPLWSPGGERLAVSLGSGVAVYDAAGSAVRTFEAAQRPTWSSNGSFIAFLKVGADGKVVPVVGEVGTGEERVLSPDIEPADPVFPIAWHPAGTVIAYRTVAYELATGTKIDLPGTAVYWSPNGRTLLVAGEFVPADRATPGLVLDAAQGFKQIIGLSIRPSAEDIPAQLFVQKWTDWTRDGRYLFYMDPEPTREFIRIYDTQAISQEIHRNIAGERPDLSPDGRHAAFMYQGKVWVFPVDASALGVVAEGGYPAWQPTP
ncbi:MAG TPA: hypothetical protein VFP63_05545 [Dehalococcoidia bacterium]|nr:hypothetical protein [Dehalococcoidia bacterium]